MRGKWFAAIVVVSAVCCPAPVLLADDRWTVGRATNDREVDLVQALIDRQRFDDALTVCRMLGRGADPQGDVTAKWAIYQSKVLAARQMSGDRFEGDDVQAAAKSVVDLLAAYPQHQRRLFLQAQVLMVERAAALHRVLRAAISPKDTDAREEATVRLLRITESLQSLADDVNETRLVLDQPAENRSYALIEDLARLHQELQVELVSLALLQTELFPTGSDDSIAAATRAEQIAEDAIARLPSDTKARWEVERLRIDSIVREQQYDRADRELQLLLDRNSHPLDARWLALQSRLDMAQERVGAVAERLQNYYGDNPIAAPRSIEMDLARLEWLLRNDPKAAAGDWLDGIELRGGAYARRRAEAMAIALLGRSQSSARPMIDPAIVAAQGQDYLRRGDPRRAAEMLAAAADAETNPDRAVARAAEAAAAFSLVEQYGDAAAVLAEIAIANPQAEQAVAAHLQAAVLTATHQPQATERLESMLRLNLEQWPESVTSPSVRSWLQKLLNGQQRYVDAAEILTATPTSQLTPETVEQIEAQWRLAFREMIDDTSKLSQRFLAAFEPLLGQPDVANTFPLLAALLVDRKDLEQVKLTETMTQSAPFAVSMLIYRAAAAESDALYEPPADVLADATERLMRDGRENPAFRVSIAQLLDRWESQQETSFVRAERRLWVGRIDDAIKELSQLIQAEPGNADVAGRAASLLQQSSDKRAFLEAIRMWDQIASSTARGGPLWHESKLSAIALLRQLGQTEESIRRAKYVLLTMPTVEDTLRKQYEQYAQ